MSMKRKSIVAVAVIASLALTSCSSSKNNDATTADTETGQGLGDVQNPGGAQNDPNTGNNPDNNDNEGHNDVPDAAATDLRTIGDNILVSFAGYELETLSEEIALIADAVSTSATSTINLPDTSVELSEQATPQTYPVSNIQYNCAQGGSLTTNTLAVDVIITEQRFSHDQDSVTYVFDQCQPDATTSETLNGTMTVGKRVVSEFRSSVTEYTYEWGSFQWQQADSTTVSITAAISALDEFTGSVREIRSVSVTDNTRRIADVVRSGVQNSSFTLSNIGGAGVSYQYTLDAVGEFTTPSGTRINVLSNPPLTRRTTGPGVDGEIEPFTGQIDFSADDGSSLSMVAKPANDVGTRLLDISYTDVNGGTTTSLNQNLVELTVFQR